MRRFTKAITAMFLIVATLAVTECKKDTEPNSAEFKIVKEYLDINATSASITGSFDYPGKINSIKVAVGQRHDFADAHSFLADINEDEFEVTLTGLKTGTEYRYRYEVDYGASKPYITEAKTFTTISESPTVKTLEVLKIDSTSFRITCEVLSDGGSEVTERGIYWNTYGTPTIGDDTLQSSGGLGLYTIRMKNLALGKKYYVRAYAKNAAGIGLSEEVLDFETGASAGTSVDIELSCNPEEGGTVNGGGSYEVGTQCTATAVANTGYTFVNWTENDIQVSSNAEYTFTVTKGRNLVANFTKQAYVVTAQVDPEDSGTVTGAGGYNYSEECTLTATAKTGYDFVKWTKGGTTVSTNAEYSFTVTTTATYVAHFSIKSYSVSVSANPSNGGTVSGGGTFNYGESRTVHATPADGFAFTNWTDDGDVVSEEANYTFPLTSNRTLVANFTELQPDEFSITVSANPSEGGTVEGGGTYQQGQNCRVKATAKPGFNFVNWTENGVQVYDLAEYPFPVEGNRVLVANFEAQAPTEYTVSVSANPSNGGTVTGGGTYEQGEQCTVSAEANTGYIFTNWTENGNVVSTNANYTFIVTSNRTLVANFQVQSYTISASANPTNGGTVTGAGTYDYGQNCPLSATAANGYTFTNWTENGTQVSTNPNYSFTVTEDRTLVANFEVQAPNTYNINVSANPPEGGTVTGGGSYQQGQQCTVSAEDNTGYTFLRWTENGNQVSTNPSYTFDVTGNRTLVAQFQVQSYTITTQVDPTGSGTVTGGGPYNYNEQCSLTATANNSAQYEFDHWTKNNSSYPGGSTITFPVTESATYTAHFHLKQYTITATVNPTNGGTISGNQSPYTYGQTCNLTATQASGYAFVRWTENGTQVSTQATYQFTVTGPRTLVAQFQQTYTITATANPTNGGTISGNQSPYTYGQTCNLTATPASNYTFTNWTENGNIVSTNASYQFTVTGNRNLVANFTYVPTTYTITLSANPTNGGTVTGGGTYNQGASCTVTATANSGYAFASWTENGNVVSHSASYTFTVTGNRNLAANFLQKPTGAICGLFSVSPTQQVWFSQGNLQYNAAQGSHQCADGTTKQGTWRFATNQWDYVGQSNENISQNYNGWIDLFGWGTSGWNCGNTYYHPWDYDNSCFACYGPPENNNLTGSYANSDWGCYNAISNGGNQTGQWRTLTFAEDDGEWYYVLFARSASTVNGTANARWVTANVNGFNGVVLFPDNYTHPSVASPPVNINEPSYNLNFWLLGQWTAMEDAGAVFLPTAGDRNGVLVGDYGWSGLYWSSQSFNDYQKVCVNVADQISYDFFPSEAGFSVRLVRNAQ